MQVINISKSILVFCAYCLVGHPSHAVGLATGPSLGITGFGTNFDAKQPLQAMDNLGLQIGWCAKVDIWLLYAKLDALLVLDWHKLPNKVDRTHFKYFSLPLTLGVPLLSIFRPHIGLVFRIPLEGLEGTTFTGNRLIESYSAKINGYIFGLGIDLGNVLIDIYGEVARLSVARKFIHASLSNGDKHYRPRQVTCRVSYNLLG